MDRTININKAVPNVIEFGKLYLCLVVLDYVTIIYSNLNKEALTAIFGDLSTTKNDNYYVNYIVLSVSFDDNSIHVIMRNNNNIIHKITKYKHDKETEINE